MSANSSEQPVGGIRRVRLLEIERLALACLDSAGQLPTLIQRLTALGQDLSAGQDLRSRAHLFAQMFECVPSAFERECRVRSLTQWIKGLHNSLSFTSVRRLPEAYVEFLFRLLGADEQLPMGCEIPLQELAGRFGPEQADVAAAQVLDERLAYASPNSDAPYGLMIHRERVLERLNELETDFKMDKIADGVRPKFGQGTTVNINGPVTFGNAVNSTITESTIQGGVAVGGTKARATGSCPSSAEFSQQLREDVQKALAALLDGRSELARVHAELPPALFRILHDLEAIGVEQSRMKETLDDLWAKHMVTELKNGGAPRTLNIINTMGSLATLQGLVSKLVGG